MRKQILLACLMLLPYALQAEVVEIDNIYYNLIPKAKSAAVAQHPQNGYIGNIVIPDSITYEGIDYEVTSIEDKAFLVCKDLNSLTLPNTITSIGKHAFASCDSLKSIELPNSITSIGEYAFDCCVGLTKIAIPEKVTTIEDATFFGCIALDSIVIPDNIKTIGEYAFRLCSGLKSVVFGNGLTSIGKYAFSDCIGIDTLVIPNNVVSIEEHAFLTCKGLTSLTLGYGLKNIGKQAFRNCEGLTSLTIPSNVTSLGDYAFNSCAGLTSVIVGNGLTSISANAFSNCTNLTSVVLPNSVTAIENYAFNGCRKLPSIIIPGNVTFIGIESFASCWELKDVYCYAEKAPTTNVSAFQDSYMEHIILHVPAASINDYKRIEPWSNFKDIVPIEGEAPEMQQCDMPTISYEDGELKFNCATEGAQFVYEITNEDIKVGNENSVRLTSTYHISVYATLSGYQDSDKATATLCWIDAEPKTEGTTENIAQIKAHPIFIQNKDGILNITGTEDNTIIQVYTTAGLFIGSDTSHQRRAIINTSLKNGETAIVKIGEKTIKVLMK